MAVMMGSNILFILGGGGGWGLCFFSQGGGGGERGTTCTGLVFCVHVLACLLLCFVL